MTMIINAMPQWYGEQIKFLATVCPASSCCVRLPTWPNSHLNICNFILIYFSNAQQTLFSQMVFPFLRMFVALHVEVLHSIVTMCHSIAFLMITSIARAWRRAFLPNATLALNLSNVTFVATQTLLQSLLGCFCT